MSKLQITVSHRLSTDEALKRIKGLLGKMKVDFADKISDLRESWAGNKGTFSFSAMGFSVSGTLEVKSSSVELNGTLPFAASLFKGKIETAVRENAEELLS